MADDIPPSGRTKPQALIDLMESMRKDWGLPTQESSAPPVEESKIAGGLKKSEALIDLRERMRQDGRLPTQESSAPPVEESKIVRGPKKPEALIDLIESMRQDGRLPTQESSAPPVEESTVLVSPKKLVRLDKTSEGDRPASKHSTRLDKLLDDYFAMEAEDAAKAGALGFMARALVQATMPHSRPDKEQTTFLRQNGAFSLALMAHPQIGLPYGSLPRLLVCFLTTEAIRNKSREIILGKSLSEFMSHLNEVPTGGRWGSISRVKNQTMRLFSSSIACTYTVGNNEGMSGMNLAVADSYKLWWDPKSPDQLSIFSSSVTLGERFYDEVISRPVPIDLRALRALKKSPLALDLYTWLTYRMSYLQKPTVVPWPALAAQFGADYTRLRSFRAAFLRQLKAVLVIYPQARVKSDDSIGLTISPSPPHIPMLRRRSRS